MKIDCTQASFGEIIRKVALPLIVGMVVLMSFNIIDLFFISLISSSSLAIFSYISPTILFINHIPYAISTGCCSYILSIDDKTFIMNSIKKAHSVIFALTIGITMLIMFNLLEENIYNYMDASEFERKFAREYTKGWQFSIPMLMLSGSFIGIMRSEGDTKTPNQILVITGIVNAILTPLLTFGIGGIVNPMGFYGAGLSTFLSYTIGIIFFLYYSYKKITIPDKISDTLLAIYKIFVISFISGLSSTLPFLSQNFVAKYMSEVGIQNLTAYSLGIRIESMLIIPFIALGITTNIFIGQCIKDKRKDKIKDYIYKSSFIIFVFSCTLTFLAFMIKTFDLLSIFGQEAHILNKTYLFLLTNSLSFFFVGSCMVINNYLYAINKATMCLPISLTRNILPVLLLWGNIIKSDLITVSFYTFISALLAFSIGLRWYFITIKNI